MKTVNVSCKNCGNMLEILAPDQPRPRISIFNLSGLFSDAGVVIVFIVCVIGIPAIFAWHKDNEFETIKKALETPGIRVEVTKNETGDVGWKILKDEVKK